MDCILYEVRDPVAVITLNRPEKLNAFTNGMLAEIKQLVTCASRDPAVVGIVITGAGRGFCSGGDSLELNELAQQGSADRVDPPGDEPPGIFSYFLDIPKPIIAAVNGPAAGGGFVLALSCDMRIGSTGAEFVSVFSKRGLVAEHGSTWLLPRQVGLGAALDLLWSSRSVGADEALSLGLLQQVTDPEELVGAACAYVERLAEQVAPSSMAETKRMVYAHAGIPVRPALVDAENSMWEALDSADAREGVSALVERRDPRFERR